MNPGEFETSNNKHGLMGYVAVHGGAGVHRHGTEKEVKEAMRDACIKAMFLRSDKGASAVNMVEESIRILEDEPSLNAGVGSNLTLDGTVECDASIMSGVDNAFGSVGAVSGVKNPIRLAKSILDYSTKQDKLGRIPPLTLVSSGAGAFARSHASAELVPEASMITDGSRSQWRKWKDRLDSNPNGTDGSKISEIRDIQDTVGAVAWHPADGIAAGVSSGGLLLKLPGRIGEAALYGAGCWAQQWIPPDENGGTYIGVACSVSGTGEHIVRAQLAKSIGEQVLSAMKTRQTSSRSEKEPRPEEQEDSMNNERDGDEGTEDDSLDTHAILQRTLEKEFWEPFRKEGELSPSAGILLLTKGGEEGEASARLWCAFTTPSMAIGYASPKHAKPKAVIMRHPDACNTRNSEKPRIYITAMPL